MRAVIHVAFRCEHFDPSWHLLWPPQSMQWSPGSGPESCLPCCLASIIFNWQRGGRGVLFVCCSYEACVLRTLMFQTRILGRESCSCLLWCGCTRCEFAASASTCSCTGCLFSEPCALKAIVYPSWQILSPLFLPLATAGIAFARIWDAGAVR